MLNLNDLVFLELTTQYVNAINGGGFPTIESSWDNVASSETEAAESRAWSLYLKRQVTETLLPI